MLARAETAQTRVVRAPSTGRWPPSKPAGASLGRGQSSLPAGNVASSAVDKASGRALAADSIAVPLLQERLGRDVGEDDLVDVDMAPALGAPIDDLDHGLLALQIGHVPTGRLQGLAILAGCRADHLAVDAEIDAGLARMVAAADEKADVPPLDAERLRGGRALRAVAAQERVDQAVAGKPLTGCWPGSVPWEGPLPKASPVIVQPS